MSSIHGGRSRRDANEPEIIAALEAVGCRAIRIDAADIGDLLVLWASAAEVDDRWCAVHEIGLIEVKMPGAKLKPGQRGWAAACALDGVRYAVVHTPAEAEAAIARWRRGSR